MGLELGWDEELMVEYREVLDAFESSVVAVVE